MANGVFNISKGRVNEYQWRVNNNDPANSALIVVLFQVIESDSALEDRATLDAVIAAAGNTEATFTNYARKVLTDTDIGDPTVDNTNNRAESDIPDQVWTAAGGAVNNDLVKLLVCYDSDTTGGTDANIIPLTYHDFVFTTNGSNLTGQVNAAGYYRAA